MDPQLIIGALLSFSGFLSSFILYQIFRKLSEIDLRITSVERMNDIHSTELKNLPCQKTGHCLMEGPYGTRN